MKNFWQNLTGSHFFIIPLWTSSADHILCLDSRLYWRQKDKHYDKLFEAFNIRWQWHPTPVLLPGESHGRGILVGCSPWGRTESDSTERLHFHFSLSRIGEGNGNPLQYSCLESPRDGEPGGLLSMGSHRVGHNWIDLAAATATLDGRR